MTFSVYGEVCQFFQMETLPELHCLVLLQICQQQGNSLAFYVTRQTWDVTDAIFKQKGNQDALELQDV